MEEAIQLVQRALDGTPDDHPHRTQRLGNLGSHLGERFSRTGDLNDLEEAIRLGQLVSDATSEDLPERVTHLYNQAGRLRT